MKTAINKKVIEEADLYKYSEIEIIDKIINCNEKNLRHVLAEYIEIMYGIEVRDIKVDEKLNIEENRRPGYIRTILEDVISKERER